MKKFILSLVAIMAVAVTTVNAKQVTHIINSHAFELSEGESYTSNGITITCISGNVGGFEEWDAFCTISTDKGLISSAYIEFDENYEAYGFYDGWELGYDGYDGVVWSGDWAKSIQFAFHIGNVYALSVTVEE